MKKRIIYSSASYEEIIYDNGYLVDKTKYIQKLEKIKNPLFLRPKRFGKSIFCTTLECYYDIDYADRFDKFFGSTWIGQNPTDQQNKCIVLSLDFSVINVGKTIQEIEYSFKRHCNTMLHLVSYKYSSFLKDIPKVIMKDAVADNLNNLQQYIRMFRLPPLYVIIDEYDDFANQLVMRHDDHLYHELTTDGSFYKTFFKTLKYGRKIGAINNVFMTGVLPIAIDDIASGFNVATIITLHPKFENMLGFTHSEVNFLLDQIYKDYHIDEINKAEVIATMKNQYDGYHFVTKDGETLYNSTLVIYFLYWFCEYKTIPDQLTDSNVRTDISWVRRLTASNPKLTKPFVNQLILHNKIRYDVDFLVSKFNCSEFFHKSFFPISFFYLGMLTRKDKHYLKLPNMNMKKIFVEYFNEIHKIDVSTRYTEYMIAFSNQPNLEKLFAGYWREYISQLPEVIFQQVNENFYRTTFYELCSRYLSYWFTWHLERSYPSGKSDLEFVGKYHEKYAGLRWVIEFKYYSNTKFKKEKTTIEDFKLKPKDVEQIAGYVKGLKKEYPQAKISQFVIYCIGNKGFKVFSI